MPPLFDAVVVGAGIAGLATAELAARSGKRIALVEANPRVCAEASGAHHGWFHFGSLYSIFPNNQFMRTLVGGIDDLLEYYSAFSSLNFRVSKSGRLEFHKDAHGWIRDEPIQYVVAARNDPDFDLRRFEGTNHYLRKLLFTAGWDLTIKQFVSRHQRFHNFDWRTGPASQNVPRAGWFDYSREVIHKPKDFGCNIDRDTHFSVYGFDRPMNPTLIAKALTGSFLRHDGQLLLNTRYTGHGNTGGTINVKTSEGVLETRNLILATGRWLSEVSTDRMRASVLASPLLIAYPHVCDVNWARLTPFPHRTINHIKHFGNDGSPYSLIGGGYFAPPSDPEAVAQAKAQLLAAAERMFPRLDAASIRHVYVSYKTEVANKVGERNYQYFVRQLDRNAYAIVPGKFSLGFSLAINAYRRIFESEPLRYSADCDGSNDDVAELVETPVHQSVVDVHLAAARSDAGLRMSVDVAA